jgi:hypothetical protein
MPKQVKKIAAAVAAAVTAPVAAVAPVAAAVAYVVPNGEAMRNLGIRAASTDAAKAEIVAELVEALRNQPYPVWDIVRAGFCGGAQSVGYADPPKLWERYALKPLAELGIIKPQSEKSSAAREVKPEVAAKQAAKKAEAEALAKMTVAEARKESERKDISDERRAAVMVAMVKRDKADKAAALKAKNDALKNLRTSCMEIIKAADDKAVLQKMHAALTKCIPVTK